jgi:hypothetical protein
MAKLTAAGRKQSSMAPTGLLDMVLRHEIGHLILCERVEA